ncbi:MAG: hypothetical protein ABII85_00285 [Bacillota bacterium]
MSKWNDIIEERNKAIAEIQKVDFNIRKNYIEKMSKDTGRDTIVYYSAWQTKSGSSGALSITDDDRISFQSVIDDVRMTNENLDLILHTPGGDLQATKMIINALRCKYKHIRAFIPNTAMSAGTMMAFACDEIWLSNSSNLGPIDPQLLLPGGNMMIPANEIGRVIEVAQKDIVAKKNLDYWAYELNKYPAVLKQMSDNSIKQAEKLTQYWLKTFMFNGDPDADRKASKVTKYFSDYNEHLTHGNHITYNEIISNVPDLKVFLLESNPSLNDLVYGVFYAYDIFNMGNEPMMKIIENQHMVGRLRNFFGGQQK